MTRISRIDLNADLAEEFPNDRRLLELVTSASLSCGAHAGDRETILATLTDAKILNVAVGAHPGFPDREGFGRVERVTTAVEVARMVDTQMVEITTLAAQVGVVIRFVKPHGALYNQAQRDAETARGLVEAVRRFGLPVLGQPRGASEREARSVGLRFIAEGFPERRYEANGRLVPRNQPDAVLHDPEEIAEQVNRLVAGGIETLCIHGDDPDAVAKAENIRAVLKRLGIEPRFWG